jgi:hypothetical protein
MRRPLDFKERDLSQYKLYSIVTNTKMTRITDADYNNPYFRRLRFKLKANDFIAKAEKAFRSAGKLVIGWQN